MRKIPGGKKQATPLNRPPLPLPKAKPPDTVGGRPTGAWTPRGRRRHRFRGPGFQCPVAGGRDRRRPGDRVRRWRACGLAPPGTLDSGGLSTRRPRRAGQRDAGVRRPTGVRVAIAAARAITGSRGRDSAATSMVSPPFVAEATEGATSAPQDGARTRRPARPCAAPTRRGQIARHEAARDVRRRESKGPPWTLRGFWCRRAAPPS